MRLRSFVILLALLVMVGAAQAAPADQSSAAITSFTSTATMVDPTALNNRTARIPVSWTTSNRPATANLVFEQVLPDGRVFNVELPRDNPWVASNGSGVTAPFPPGGDAEEVVLRVRLVDTVNANVLDEESITIPIGTVPAPEPTISSFSTSATSVGRNSLSARTARIPVSWAVDNRPDGSNLVFEQVLADGSSVNVELPRSNPFVASSGNGVAAPVPPGGDATSITLRLRLINLNTQSTLTSKDITLPITDNDAPVISSFTTSATNVGRNALTGKTARVPVSWSVDNRPANSNLVFEQVLADGSSVNVELPRSNPFVSSAGNGVAAPVAPGGDATSITLRLRVIDLSSQATLAQKDITLPIVDNDTPTITTFTSTAASVGRGALTARTARVPVTWLVTNRPANSNLVFEQVLDNGTVVNVELPRNNPFVGSEGNGVAAPVNPGTSSTVKLQVRLINLSTQAELAKKELTLTIVEAGVPTITLFNTTTASVDTGALAAHTARIPVSWNVDNRPDGSNLVFEQVLGDGTSVNVELPRQNPYVSSSGTGVAAPVSPGGTMTMVQLRLRLVKTSDNSTLTSKDITIPISGLTVPTATAAPSANAPQITSFTVSPTSSNPGATVTLNWTVVNATSISLNQLAQGLAAAPLTSGQVSATGSLNVTIPADASGSVTYELLAGNAGGQETRATAVVTINGSAATTVEPAGGDCQFATSLAETCPITQETLSATYQPFDKGFMVWNGNTQTIYVMFDDGTWEQFADTWQSGDPELPGNETAPEGKLVPVRGFGKVWEQLGGADTLGWATAEEAGYQATWETHPMLDGDQSVNTPHFTLPNGDVIHLGSIWSMG